jgi:anti-anti-sigma factor
MPNAPASLMVAAPGEQACLKVIGRATFALGPDLRGLLYGLHQRDYRRFLLDLTQCACMDSTFLGVLAGFVRQVVETGDGRGEIRLVNPNPRVRELLDNLGVFSLFQVDEIQGGVAADYVAVAVTAPSKLELARTALEAHQTLMAIAPNNIPKFKDVARFLAEDVRRFSG